tara:strand:- start:51 stop:602 length:552 start_codon:yes stop_codon:yes gene_type:complete
MVKNKQYNYDNINNYTKKGFLATITSGMYIFDYKIIMYWLPIILFYILFLFIIIILFDLMSEMAAAGVACILIYILYFCIDIVYQILLCKNTKYFKLIKNSLLNAIYPAVFVLIGYILAMFLKDNKNCSSYNDLQENMSGNIRISYLFNIHTNNIIVSIFFYIFSIFYINPLNKKKCISNNLC